MLNIKVNFDDSLLKQLNDQIAEITEDLAKSNNMSVKMDTTDLEKAKEMFKDVEGELISFKKKISYDKEGNKITILDILKTEDPDYIEDIYKNDNIKLLKKHLNILTKREREIIEARYGLKDRDEETQKDIAKRLNISRSYVSRLEKRATSKILREFLKESKK